MTRPVRVALIAGGSLAGLLLLLLITGILVVRSAWFQDMVRQRIVTATADATGGRVDVGSFAFDWTHMRVAIRDFTIHGLEPAGAPPLFRAGVVEAGLGFGSAIAHVIGIRYLDVTRPLANVMVFPDGRTNVPSPKVPSTGNRSGLQTVVDLAIGRFEVRNGSFTFANRKIDFNARGQDLRANLGYNVSGRDYRGEIDIDPLFLQSGNNAPVNASVKLPVTIAGDSISVEGARVSTPGSQATASASVTHMADPVISGSLDATVALDELKRAAGSMLPLDTSRGPKVLEAKFAGTWGGGQLRLQSARLTLGETQIHASGTGNPARPANVKFEGRLALGQLGRLFKVAAQPEGAVTVGGSATLRSPSDYLVMANLAGRGIAFRGGGQEIRGVDVQSAVAARPNLIQLQGIRLAALGGSFNGSAQIQNGQFHLAGDLRDLNIERFSRTLLGRDLGVSGVFYGPIQAEGPLGNFSAVKVKTDLSSTPPRGALPLSGRLRLSYSGASNAVTIEPSMLRLAHTVVTLSGTLGKELRVRIVSRDLADIRRIASLPANLSGGTTVVNATITGPLASPRIAAQLDAANFTVDGRRFDRLTSAVDLSRSGVTFRNADLVGRQGLRAHFDLSAGLRNWKPLPTGPLRVDGTIRNGELRDILALAGRPGVPASGALAADVHVAGTLGSSTGSAQFSVVNGVIGGEPFDSISGRTILTANAIDVPSLALVAGPSRIDAQAAYQHSTNNLANGTLQVHVASSQVQLAQFQTLVKNRPGLRGIVSLNGGLNATVRPSPTGAAFQVTRLDANLRALGLQMEGHDLGDFTAIAATSGNTVRYRIDSDFAGSTVAVNGESLLTGDHATTASASIANLPLERVLAVAGRADIPVRGTLSGAAQVSGTLAAPRANAAVRIARGSAYGEAFDALEASIGYTDRFLQVSRFDLVKGNSRIQIAGSFAHPPGDYRDGQLRFDVRANQLQLARFQTLQQYQPGLDGVVQFAAAGAATLRRNAVPLVGSLNATLDARRLSLSGNALGNVAAGAETQGKEIVFHLQSDVANAAIQGSGRMQVGADYPLQARLAFSNLTYAGLKNWAGWPDLPLQASAEGQIDVSGPLTRPADMRGTVQIARLEAHARPAATRRPTGTAATFEIHNAAPIVLALEHATLSVKSFRMTGTDTNLSVAGTLSLAAPAQVNARVAGDFKLAMLEAFDPNIFAGGDVALDASLTGDIARPALTGILSLQNASFTMVTLPAGLSNANGTIAFTGKQAIIQNVTGEIGGGRTVLTGFVTYAGPQMQFRVEADADRVRVNYPATVTTRASARLTLTGTSSRSLLSGNVTILGVTLHSQADIGSLLTPAAAPTPIAVRTGVLAGMRFDVRIRTSPEAQLRTSLTQNLQADADLTLRGSLDQTGMLGRITVTQGQAEFFGTRYQIDQGTVTFSDPTKIDPVVNVNLVTRVQGVQVSISVTGPVSRLKLTYHSDPPMQFTDLVGLLAAGSLPTTDPVLAARAPAVMQPQGFPQAGASALLSQAAANPVAGRLQRLFGVTRVSINPQFVGVTNTAQAALTVQQQITPDITFTYTQDVTRANTQIVRVEWAIDRHWSAIARRDIYGQFNLDFFYRKRFR